MDIGRISMTSMKKFLSVFLVLAIVITCGIITAAAAGTSAPAAADSVAKIVIHANQDGVNEPYIYLWNSLPTNSAMSKSYPGEKMTKSGEWYDYTVSNVTKVNALITDADGKQ